MPVILCINSLRSLLGLLRLSCSVGLTELNCYMIECDCSFYSSLNQYLLNKVDNDSLLMLCLCCRKMCCSGKKRTSFLKKALFFQKVPQPLVEVQERKKGRKKKTEKRRKIFLDVLQNIYDQRQIAFLFLLQHGRLMSKKFVLMQTSNP